MGIPLVGTGVNSNPGFSFNTNILRQNAMVYPPLSNSFSNRELPYLSPQLISSHQTKMVAPPFSSGGHQIGYPLVTPLPNYIFGQQQQLLPQIHPNK